MKKSIIRVLLLLSPLLWQGNAAVAQSSYSLRSPDKKIEVKIRTGDRVRYDVLFDGKVLLQDSTLSIKIDQKTYGLEPKIRAAKERSHDQMLEPPVRQKSAKIRENYNELRLEMEGDYAVVFRAYNEGAAYRLETSLPQNEVQVYSEEVGFNFTGNYSVYYPLKEKLERDRDLKITESADYIAVTKGTRSYPWRLLGIAEKDGDLITLPSTGNVCRL